jgi:hypothetical protein
MTTQHNTGAGNAALSVTLTALEAQEVAHKLGVLNDTPDLREDYGLTQEQADTLQRSVPWQGGEWAVPAGCEDAVRGEMADAATVLRAMAHDARGELNNGQALALSRLAAQLERKFK